MREDIRIVKQNLRAELKAIRMGMEPETQAEKDWAIFRKICELPEYKAAKRVFVYVSTDIEVDTRRIIEQALSDGKTVAVPRCLPGKIAMDFHRIDSMDDLFPGAFGVLEPDPQRSPILCDYRDSICILPGLGYDPDGYRIGYGKGYYDRFVTNFTGVQIGVCYGDCIRPQMPRGRYDRSVSILVTEDYVKRISK